MQKGGKKNVLYMYHASKRAVHYRILMQALHLAGCFVKGDGFIELLLYWTNKMLLSGSKAFSSIPLKKTWYFVTKIVLTY